MTQFLGKRVMILAVILAVVAFFVRERDYRLALGILMGAVAAVYKIRFYKKMFEILFGSDQTKHFNPILIYIFSLAINILLLLVSILTDIWLFAGVTTGLLLMPAMICVNGITEKTGLTENKWNERW